MIAHARRCCCTVLLLVAHEICQRRSPRPRRASQEQGRPLQSTRRRIMFRSRCLRPLSMAKQLRRPRYSGIARAPTACQPMHAMRSSAWQPCQKDGAGSASHWHVLIRTPLTPLSCSQYRAVTAATQPAPRHPESVVHTLMETACALASLTVRGAPDDSKPLPACLAEHDEAKANSPSPRCSHISVHQPGCACATQMGGDGVATHHWRAYISRTSSTDGPGEKKWHYVF